MLPLQLDQTLGSKANELTDVQRTAATTFTTTTPGTGENARDVINKHIITKVEIKIKDIYLQVRQIIILLNLNSSLNCFLPFF